MRTTRLTPRGEAAVATLAAARERLLGRALTGFDADERETFSRLFARFADGLSAVVADDR